VYYTYTSSFGNDYNRVDSFFIMKTKLSNCVEVEVIKDDNNEVSKWDDVFQIDEIVDSHWVTPSTELENINFHVIENTYIDEWNDILSTSKHNEVTLNSTKKMMKMKRRILIKRYYIDLDVIQSSYNTIYYNSIMHCIFYICCGFRFNGGNRWL